MISEKAQALSERLFRRLFRFVFRYDIFISYARGDGARYAVALKDQLTRLDFSCFLDVEELPPGNALTRTLQRALKGSATLVAVVTERAAASHYCRLEVDSFTANERAIVPIDFGGTVAKAPWACLKDRELVWIDETPEALERGVPSPIVADSIDRLFKYTRRNVRVRGQWIGVLVLFLLGAAAAGLMIRQQANEARAAGLESERQKAEAVKQTAIALDQKAEAVKQTAIATEATRTAEIAQKQANEAAAEAKKQEEIALENAARAREEQRKAEAQTRLALSSSMAIDAGTQLERRPLSALLLAAEATQVVLRGGGARAPAAEDALRQALARAGGTPLTGHTGTVYTVVLSADQRWLFTSASDGVGRLWSLREPRLDAPMYELKAHNGLITSASFSPDNRWLATGGRDNVVRVWDLAAKPVVAAHDLQTGGKDLPTNPREIRVIGWSPDSRRIAAAGDVPRLWDLSKPDAQGSAVQLKGHSYDVEKIVFSDDGRWLVTATRDSYVLLWPLSSGMPAGEPLKLPTASDVAFAAFSKDGRWLAAGGSGKGVRLFDLAAAQIAASVRELKVMERAYKGTFSPDSRWLAVAGPGSTAQLWDLSLPDPEQSPIALTHEGAASTSDSILYVAFNSTSRLLLTAGTFGTGAGAHLWRLDTPDVPASRVALQGIGRYATAAAFLETDKVAVATLDGLSIWDVRGNPDKTVPGKLVGHDGSVSGILADARGQWMITSARDSTPRFWNTGAWQVGDQAGDTLPRRLSDETAHQRRVELSADGRWAVSETQDRRSVFAFASKTPDARFARRAVVSGPFLALSLDGLWLATSESRETSNNVWRTGLSLLELSRGDERLKERQLVGATEQKVDEGQRRGPPVQRVTAAAFSPNSKTLAAGRGDGLVTLWNVPVTTSDRGRELRGHKDAIETIAFSRDGRWMATGGADMKVFLWDLTAREPAATARELSGHDGRVQIATFSADGHWLFTASGTKDDLGDGKRSAFLWDLRQPGVAGTSLAGHEGSVTAADISADGRWLATGGRGPLRLWDLAQKNPAARPTRLDAGNRGPVVSIGFTRNGRMLLARFESSALLWDLRRAGPELRPFVMGRGLGDITWAGFSPDNTQLITGGYRDGTLYAWDLMAEDPTVAPVALRGDTGGVFAGAISADGRVLVGASNEGVKAWLLQPADLVARACRIAGRNLTVPDWDVLVPGQPYHKTCADYPATER